MGNVETKGGVGCIHQQLTNHDKRAQFIKEGFLVVGQNERAASGRHQAENWESVNDEAQLFVRQQGVGENETHCRQQQKPHASVEKAARDKEERAAQGSGQRRVEVPQKGCGSPV